MENLEKLRILIDHWIEHNEGHTVDFEKWQKIMAEDGQQTLSDKIGEAIQKVKEIDTILHDALKEAGGKPEGHSHHHHHHH